MQGDFVQIEAEFLSTVATNSDRVPTLYYSNYTLVQKVFWLRLRFIHKLMAKFSKGKEKCLDFGGGGGVFLPTLSNTYKHVVCVDLENEEAQKTVAHYSLPNIELVRGDVSNVSMPSAPFNVIVAADVLEHFKDLSVAIDAVIPWLADDGVFYTSLPTENWIYVFLRKVFHIEKPWDHYHTAVEVEAYLHQRGFEKIKGIYVPLYFPLFPLFRISAWKKKI